MVRDAYLDFAHDRQVIAQEQIIVTMDTARQRIFNGDEPPLGGTVRNRIKNRLEGLTW